MGWFLTKNKRKTRTATRRTKTKTAQPWDPQKTLRSLKIIAIFALIGSIVWAWHAGEPYLRAYATQQASHNAPADGDVRIHLVDAPPWMAHGSLLRQEIITLVGRQLSTDPLGAMDLDRAVHALRESAWIEEVHRIERIAVDKVNVHAVYRVPTALIATLDARRKTDRGYHLIDAHGVRLLAHPYPPDRLPDTNLPLIQGVKSAAPNAGELWSGDEIQAALQLIALLQTRPYYEQIAAIDVAHRDRLGRIRMQIVATNGGRIDWGFPPGKEHVMEPHAQFKLAGIDEFYRMYNMIAAPQKVVEVFNDVVMVRAAR